MDDAQWPEYIGSHSWLPLEAVGDLVGELVDLLGGEVGNGWIRAVTGAGEPPSAEGLELIWIGAGCLCVASLTDVDGLWRVVWRRAVPLGEMATRVPLLQVHHELDGPAAI